MYMLHILCLPFLPYAWQAGLRLLQYLDSLTLWFLVWRYSNRLRVRGRKDWVGRAFISPFPLCPTCDLAPAGISSSFDCSFLPYPIRPRGANSFSLLESLGASPSLMGLLPLPKSKHLGAVLIMLTLSSYLSSQRKFLSILFLISNQVLAIFFHLT